jgi:flavin reductase (DIM6/NTAB) family NADH-FMN oxidoreductase RutF
VGASGVRDLCARGSLHPHVAGRDRRIHHWHTRGVDRKILGRAGNVTGRDIDKIAELGLHTVKSQVVSVPAIAEAAVTLECRVVFRQLQDRNALPADFIDRFYPQDVPSTNCLGNRDMHIAYYGEVVAAYRM